MVVVPLSRSVDDSELAPAGEENSSNDWLLYSAAGTLVAGGVLLATGNRKAGLVVAATGAALAMLDQQEAVLSCWNALPGYIAEIQDVLTRVQDAVDEIAVQGAKLREALGK